MNKGDIIITIDSIKDIEKINKNTKYINIAIDSVDMDVIDYFLLNGQDYLYSDRVNDNNGFIYIDYNTFKDSEKVIDNIIDNMPNNLSDIEKIRYIYISLGKILCLDININENKNEVISFNNISTINNIWGSISRLKTTDLSISKLFMYLCHRVGIKSEIVNTNVNNIGNKVYINDNDFIIVQLYNDLSYIQGGFVTKFFDKYNNDKSIDKRIGYINDEYTDFYINRVLSNIDSLDSDVIGVILSLTEKILNIDNIGTLELSSIYKNIFKEYLPNYDIRINNFYIVDEMNKKHFIVINYGDLYYSYNYSSHKFIKVRYEDIYKNIESNLIGLYCDEDFIRNKKEVLV